MQHRDDMGTKKLPRVMLAAPASGSGKTLVTCGLLQALVNRRIQTAAFKCGPDYIDPMFHTRVIGVPSRNLDTFFTDAQTTRWLFGRQAKEAELSVMEGVMGFYDGVAGITTRASSWELARVTETPVILVVNARRMSLSVVPLIEGFLNFPKTRQSDKCQNANIEEDVFWEKTEGARPASRIYGVILNQVSVSMYPDLKREIESRLPVRVLGYVPRVDDCVIESRHLGLVTPDEIAGLKGKLQRLAGILEETLAIDSIIALAQSAPALDVSMPENLCKLFQKQGERALLHPLESAFLNGQTDAKNKNTGLSRVRIAVARDEAFCFSYADNLELLETLGARLVFFSPLHDASLPENIQGLLLGGGYPELYARTLSENASMLESVRKHIRQGLPFLAECGGFLYLHESMEDMNGKAYPMAGVFPARAYKTGRLGRFGYITLSANTSRGNVGAGHLVSRVRAAETENKHGSQPDTDSPSRPCGFLDAGEQIRAHEFHYFDSTENGAAFHAQKPYRKRGWDCILAGEHFAAGFPHLYYYSNPAFAARFIAACESQNFL